MWDRRFQTWLDTHWLLLAIFPNFFQLILLDEFILNLQLWFRHGWAVVFRKVEDDKGGQKFSERGLNFLPTKYSSLNKADSWNETQAEMSGFIEAKSDTAIKIVSGKSRLF